MFMTLGFKTFLSKGNSKISLRIILVQKDNK
jgi:hypothetical protein